MSDRIYELVVIRPGDGHAVPWNKYAERGDADAERIKLARQGFYAVVRRIASPIREVDGAA